VAGRTRPGFGRVAFGTSRTERLEGNRATDAAGARRSGLRGRVKVPGRCALSVVLDRLRPCLAPRCRGCIVPGRSTVFGAHRTGPRQRNGSGLHLVRRRGGPPRYHHEGDSGQVGPDWPGEAGSLASERRKSDRCA
jgi:hypothetical protein